MVFVLSNKIARAENDIDDSSNDIKIESSDDKTLSINFVRE